MGTIQVLVVTLVLFGWTSLSSRGDLTVGRKGLDPPDLVIDLPEGWELREPGQWWNCAVSSGLEGGVGQQDSCGQSWKTAESSCGVIQASHSSSLVLG